jgi:hypothetical protein
MEHKFTTRHIFFLDICILPLGDEDISSTLINYNLGLQGYSYLESSMGQIYSSWIISLHTRNCIRFLILIILNITSLIIAKKKTATPALIDRIVGEGGASQRYIKL